jgi:general secretion pathway protein G
MAMKSHRKSEGFSIIELLVTMTIIGIVAGIAIPNLLNASHRGKQKSTMSNLRSIGTAIETYQSDLGFPPRQASLGDIGGTVKDALEPTYIKLLPTEDAWETRIKYVCAGTDSYTIRSYGRDRVYDSNETPGTTASYNNDIVFCDGQFTIAPDGLQK